MSLTAPMTTEREYLLTEAQCLYTCMLALTDKEAKAAGNICSDMVKVIMAWRRGKLLPRWEVPHLNGLCEDFKTPDYPPMPSGQT
jgi:hypothetical protein